MSSQPSRRSRARRRRSRSSRAGICWSRVPPYTVIAVSPASRAVFREREAERRARRRRPGRAERDRDGERRPASATASARGASTRRRHRLVRRAAAGRARAGALRRSAHAASARAPGAPQRERELIVRLRVVGREPDGLAESLDGAAVVARLHLLDADADRERRGLRVGRPPIQPIGFGELRGGGLPCRPAVSAPGRGCDALRPRVGRYLIASRNCGIASSSAPCCFRTVPSM